MLRLTAPLAMLALAGCVASTPPPASAPAPRVSRPAATRPPAVAPSHVQPTPPGRLRQAVPLALPGLEGVIGADAAALTGRFGTARLDIREGDARKLQFADGACVLDVYLYPPNPRSEPRATYVDARLPDGRDTDRAGCVAALSRR